MQKIHIIYAIHVRKVAVRERKWEIEGGGYIMVIVLFLYKNVDN